MASAEAHANKDPECEDQPRNQERILFEGFSYLFQSELDFWRFHSEYLLDLIVGIVAFRWFVGHDSVGSALPAILAMTLCSFLSFTLRSDLTIVLIHPMIRPSDLI